MIIEKQTHPEFRISQVAVTAMAKPLTYRKFPVRMAVRIKAPSSNVGDVQFGCIDNSEQSFLSPGNEIKLQIDDPRKIWVAGEVGQIICWSAV